MIWLEAPYWWFQKFPGKRFLGFYFIQEEIRDCTTELGLIYDNRLQSKLVDEDAKKHDEY